MKEYEFLPTVKKINQKEKISKSSEHFKADVRFQHFSLMFDC